MDERIRKWLIDILSSIEEIESFLLKIPVSFAAYQGNQLLKRGIERNLEIIGEAMNRIISRDEGFVEKIAEARNIIGLRNQIIHSYDNVSDENIWSILINHLPDLKMQVADLLK